MKKKITALFLALTTFWTVTAFAETVSAPYENGKAAFTREGNTKAVITCYDENGKLCASSLCKSEDGAFNASVAERYKDMKKKVYFIDTKELCDLVLTDASASPSPSPSAKPEDPSKPEVTPEPSAKPESPLPSIYEKEVDAVYAPAFVDEVTIGVDKDGNEVYAATVFYCGSEVTVGIDTDLTISSAPEEYSFMVGKSAESLEKGDVVYLTANIAGDEIRDIDFIFRPTEEDIATSDVDYGTNFEKLFVSNGKVAGKWDFMRYGQKASNEKYQYAFGIIGKYDGKILTLINKDGDEDNAVEIDVQNDTIVYSCDVDGKEYDARIDDISAISATIPQSAFSDTGKAALDDTYPYNYALVRTVNGVATEVILYNNYNN